MRNHEAIVDMLKTWKDRLKFHEEQKNTLNPTLDVEEQKITRIIWSLSYAQSAVDSLEWVLGIGPKQRRAEKAQDGALKTLPPETIPDKEEKEQSLSERLPKEEY